MKITSSILNGAKSIVKGWHPVDPEGYAPFDFYSEEKELNAARKTAWIGVYLMPTGRIELEGSDVVKLLNNHCTNKDFSTLKIGASRHVITCNKNGYIYESGILTRMSENKYYSYCLFSLMEIAPNTDLDVIATMVDEFFIQIDGPKSLEIMEEASRSDIHDLKFGQNKMIKIAGTDVFIHRLGMSGALAYEIHGNPENQDTVYEAVVQAGEKYGAVRQGLKTYPMNHTPGGYPNQFNHFAYPDADGDITFKMPTSGSAADNIDNYFVTPYDIGWGNLVNFDHEFTGKEALLKAKANDNIVPVTLEWDLDEVMGIYADEFKGISVEADESIFGYSDNLPEFKRVHIDYVMVNDKKIGVTGGRVKDYFHKSFISLAFIDKDFATEGNNVNVMWGKPGKPQKEIHAKVARFPYYNEEYRNETFDVEKIPHRKF